MTLKCLYIRKKSLNLVSQRFDWYLVALELGNCGASSCALGSNNFSDNADDIKNIVVNTKLRKNDRIEK